MKTILITGASRGIGRATALELSKKCDCIAVISRNRDHRLNDVVLEIQRTSDCLCLPFSGDVSDFTFTQRCVSELAAAGHPVDILVNNAGISKIGLLQDMTPEEFDEIVRINLTSVYNTCHAVIPGMIRRQSGRILNISSVWGLVGASCEVAYSATKGAVNSFTRALAKELAPSHISVNAVAFGMVDTDMNRHLSADEQRVICDEIPAGKAASPEEAAACICRILTMPDYLTGEIIRFDGGWI